MGVPSFRHSRHPIRRHFQDPGRDAAAILASLRVHLLGDEQAPAHAVTQQALRNPLPEVRDRTGREAEARTVGEDERGCQRCLPYCYSGRRDSNGFLLTFGALRDGRRVQVPGKIVLCRCAVQDLTQNGISGSCRAEIV